MVLFEILSSRLKRAIFHFSTPSNHFPHAHINITQKRSSQTDNKWKNIKINYDCGEKRFPFYTDYSLFCILTECMKKKRKSLCFIFKYFIVLKVPKKNVGSWLRLKLNKKGQSVSIFQKKNVKKD